ncbi:SDR family oxidoreductase [Pseudonocardia ailaonensis]|uniref:SDR family oxidoreductase n=1 Tax=Pseudonocardia ailaonensis TaxID=367279 RepID=A0ABN2N0X3_9PSEU
MAAAEPTLADMMDLSGRVALLAGGHGPLAAPIAAALAELGCSIVLAARRTGPCEELADSLVTRLGATVDVRQLDVSDEAQVDGLVAGVVSRHGSLDVVVNNAATFWAAPPEDVPLERGWQRVVDVNLTGTFLVCRAAGRVMLAAGRGSIINMASSVAFISFLPEVGSTLSYTVSKGAVVTLTRDLASQWAGRGVRVNAVAPGSMDSGLMESVPDERKQRMVDQIPAGRLGRPHELKGAVAFLASDLSSYVTGSVVRVDGGQTLL